MATRKTSAKRSAPRTAEPDPSAFDRAQERIREASRLRAAADAEDLRRRFYAKYPDLEAHNGVVMIAAAATQQRSPGLDVETLMARVAAATRDILARNAARTRTPASIRDPMVGGGAAGGQVFVVWQADNDGAEMVAVFSTEAGAEAHAQQLRDATRDIVTVETWTLDAHTDEVARPIWGAWVRMQDGVVEVEPDEPLLLDPGVACVDVPHRHAARPGYAAGEWLRVRSATSAAHAEALAEEACQHWRALSGAAHPTLRDDAWAAFVEAWRTEHPETRPA